MKNKETMLEEEDARIRANDARMFAIVDKIHKINRQYGRLVRNLDSLERGTREYTATIIRIEANSKEIRELQKEIGLEGLQND